MAEMNRIERTAKNAEFHVESCWLKVKSSNAASPTSNLQPFIFNSSAARR
jgi:hypothetical protein